VDAKSLTGKIGTVIIVLIIFILIVLGFSLFIITEDVDVDNVIISNDFNNDIGLDIKYNFGDEVVFLQLSKYIYSDSIYDMSTWRVLEVNEDYIRLYSVSDVPWGNVKFDDLKENLSSNKNFMEEHGIVFGDMGSISLLSANDLNLLGCNVSTMSCVSVPKWFVQTGYTDVVLGKNTVVTTFNNGKLGLDTVNIVDGQIGYWPVITILKTNVSYK